MFPENVHSDEEHSGQTVIQPRMPFIELFSLVFSLFAPSLGLSPRLSVSLVSTSFPSSSPPNSDSNVSCLSVSFVMISLSSSFMTSRSKVNYNLSAALEDSPLFSDWAKFLTLISPIV